MWIKFTNPNFYYIDPSQEYIENVWQDADHDGSSVVKAARALPETLQDNTIYLIRRTDPSNSEVWCTLMSPVKSIDNADHIAIIGMPHQAIQLTTDNISWYAGKSYLLSETKTGTYTENVITEAHIDCWIKRDDIYDYMPTDAKEAWSDDEFERAIIAEGAEFYTGDCFIELRAKGTLFANIDYKQRYKYWYEKGNINYDMRRDPYNWALYVSSESTIIKDCKFSVINNDLTNDEYANFGQIRDEWNKVCHRIRLDYSTSCIFEYNIFVSSPISNWDRTCRQICFNTSDGKAYIRNNIVHNAGSKYDNISPVFDFQNYNSNSRRDIVIIQNIKEYIYKISSYYENNKHYCSLRPLLGGWLYEGTIKDIFIESSQKETAATTWPRINRANISISARTNFLRVENININFPECRGNASMLSFWKGWENNRDQSKHAPDNQWIIIKDITATFADYGDTTAYSAEGGTILSVGDDILNRSTEDIYPCYRTTCSQIIVQNVNIKASMAGSDNYALDCSNALINMAENNIEGRVVFVRCIGKIGKIKTYFVQNAFVDNGYNLIYCDGIECNKEHPSITYNGQQALSPSWWSKILVKSTNTIFIADTTKNNDPGNRSNCLYVCPSDQSEGQFTIRNHKCKAEAWSVNRTGGHQCTLRLVCKESDSSSTPLVIGGTPFKGITTNLKKGLNKCTIYFTGYGYLDFTELPKYVRIEAKKPDGSYVGGDCGQWEIDTTSEWNNIDNNSSYKYVMYIDMEEDGEVEFTYRFWWYTQLDAYTFIDPFPIVEQV